MLEKKPAIVNEKKYHLLYIDDSVQAGRLMTIYMQRAGFCVTVVKSVAEARIKLAGSRVDAIISDIGLPGESGVEFFYWLKKTESYKNIPVLLASAHVFELDDFLSEHRELFFTKPLFFPDLINRLRKMLEKQK